MTTFRIGIDLGGTKIEAAALDDRGAIHLRQRLPTPAGDYADTIAAIATLVSRIEREIGAGASVGIAIPGTIVVATGLVKNANSVWLNGKPLGQDVEAVLGRPVRFANDANCFALSLSFSKAARAPLSELLFANCAPSSPRSPAAALTASRSSAASALRTFS